MNNYAITDEKQCKANAITMKKHANIEKPCNNNENHAIIMKHISRTMKNNAITIKTKQ